MCVLLFLFSRQFFAGKTLWLGRIPDAAKPSFCPAVRPSWFSPGAGTWGGCLGVSLRTSAKTSDALHKEEP